MQKIHVCAFATAMLVLVAGPSAGQAQDSNRSVADGGVQVAGWTGAIDAGAAEDGQTLDDALLAAVGDALRVTTGPAVTYWNPENTADGDYTVSATFTEPEYMNLNNHPHPYGLFIGGTGMGTEEQRYLYCAAYGNGRFIVRGFGPEPFRLNGRRAEAHEAVNEAAGRGEPVTQEIALSVRDGTVACAINGTVVASYDRSEVVTDGRLRSTDGVYGIRFAHNTEAVVENLTLTRH